MKKLLLCFLFLGFLLIPNFKTYANALPTPSANTLSVIEGGNSALSYSAFSTIDVLPINKDPVQLNRIIGVASGDPLVIGANLNTVGIDDYTIRKLTQSEIEDIQSSQYDVFYNANGQIVDIDDVYYMSYINKMFTGKLYVDGNGDILTTDINNTKPWYHLSLGGYLLNRSDIANIYDDIKNSLENNSYNYFLDENPNSDYSYYLFFAPYAGLRDNKVYSFYIPNQYVEGYVIPVTTNNGALITEWYSTVPNPFNYSGPSGVEYNVGVQSGTWTVNGYTYSYKITFPTNYRIDRFPSVNNTYASFLNGNQYNDPNVFARVGNYYIPNNFTNDVVPFEKIYDLPSTKQIQIDDEYDYSSIKEYEESLGDTSSTPSETYDPSKHIDETNYPLITEIPISTPVVEPGTLPFPSTSPDGDPDPDPNPNTEPSIQYDPDIQPTNEEVELSFDNFQIPFVSGLFNRYPFCIPWDIKNFINSLKAEPQAPAWDFDYSITVAGHTYTTHFEGDLSDYNTLATIFRNLLLIGFIIGLCKFSYDHHF